MIIRVLNNVQLDGETILFLIASSLSLSLFLVSVVLRMKREFVKNRLSSKTITNIRSKVSTTLAMYIASILGDAADKNGYLTNIIRLHSINVTIIVGTTLISLHIMKIQYQFYLLSYPNVLQAIGSFFLAAGSVYMARHSFSNEYLHHFHSHTPSSDNSIELENLFVFVKGFSYMFWGAGILLLGYIFLIYARIYSAVLHSIPLTEKQLLILITSLFIVVTIGLVDSVIQASATISATLGAGTFLIGTFVGSVAMIVGLITMVVSIGGLPFVYDSLEVGAEIDTQNIDAEGHFVSHSTENKGSNKQVELSYFDD